MIFVDLLESRMLHVDSSQQFVFKRCDFNFSSRQVKTKKSRYIDISIFSSSVKMTLSVKLRVILAKLRVFGKTKITRNTDHIIKTLCNT
jgi:hypothetical protein